MSWDIAACGTLHRDDITTPHGTRVSLGGSAVYFALAASRFAPVHLNGIVGADAIDDFRTMLTNARIDLTGVVIAERPTFLWHATHDFERWVTSHESAEPGCDREWHPQLAARSRESPVLFVGSMDPRLQRELLEQSTARLVGADTMAVFIREQTEAVRSVVESADVVFMNADELRLLTSIDGWQQAARSLCGRGRTHAVVVKHGPDGAACVTIDGVHAIPAHPVERVVDPTGAGDALAGGFLGYCASAERDARGVIEVVAEALATGVRCAAGAVTAFGVAGLLDDPTGDAASASTV